MSFVYQNKASEARKKEQDSLFGLPQPAIEGLLKAVLGLGLHRDTKESLVHYGLPYKYGRRTGRAQFGFICYGTQDAPAGKDQIYDITC